MPIEVFANATGSPPGLSAPDAVTGSSSSHVPFSRHANPKDRVAFFVGNDITALLIANQITQAAGDSGFRPALYFPEHKPSPKPEAQSFPVRELALYERDIPNEVIYPFLEGEKLQEGVNYTPKQLAAKYGITVMDVPDVNDPAFLKKEILDKDTVGAINIRGYQIFSQTTIDAFNKRLVLRDGTKVTGFLLNFHPGKLGKKDKETEYRGIWTPLRVMLNGEETNWWTLHKVEAKIDTGPIVERAPHVINYQQPLINIYFDYADVGAGMILNHLVKFKDGELLIQDHPREKRGKLWSYPEQIELEDFLKKGHRLVDAHAYVDFCVAKFVHQKTTAGKALALQLRKEIERHIQDWYSKNEQEYRAFYGRHAEFGDPKPGGMGG